VQARYYVLEVTGGVDIEKYGPYETKVMRDRKARKVNNGVRDYDSVFWLDQKVDGSISVGCYSEQELIGRA
jgi:hypothetical protein